jgi:type II secretory pathway pseudopilin PulG
MWMLPRYKRKYESGFTLVGLGCSITVTFLLLLLVSPSLRNRAAKSREILCMANQRQIARAMHLYVDDNRDIFPAHRETHEDSPLPVKWWGTSTLGYVGGNTNLYRCPLLSGERVGTRRMSDWAFNAHEVRYGYNAFFLGIAPYDTMSITVAGVKFTGAPWFKRSNIVRPSDNLLLGDRDASNATPQPMWTSTLWWPVAGSDGMFKEGVAPRHRKRGVVVFNDGHAEVRSSARINPPLDPSQGHPRALINSEYWDPVKSP